MKSPIIQYIIMMIMTLMMERRKQEKFDKSLFKIFLICRGEIFFNFKIIQLIILSSRRIIVACISTWWLCSIHRRNRDILRIIMMMWEKRNFYLMNSSARNYLKIVLLLNFFNILFLGIHFLVLKKFLLHAISQLRRR